jgi:hypothetical protein
LIAPLQQVLHSPVRSYRFTVTIFPLPIQNELKYR